MKKFTLLLISTVVLASCNITPLVEALEGFEVPERRVEAVNADVDANEAPTAEMPAE